MNTYLFYRRIRGPVFLLTFGVTALLWEWHVLDFAQSWPLYLIVGGVLRLAEGAAIAASAAPPFYPPQGFGGVPAQQTAVYGPGTTYGTATGTELTVPPTSVEKPGEGS